MAYPHWEYFLSLDDDLGRAVRFVEPDQNNFQTYSIELMRLLLGACAEIDVVAKALTTRLNQVAPCENIDDYRQVIMPAYPGFATVKVVLPRYGLTFTPWSAWGSNVNPPWWKSHNKVKHERTQNFPEANLQNCLESMAGLFVLLVYYYQPDLYDHKLRPWPNLYHLHSDHYHDFRFVGTYILPDFGNSDEWKNKKKNSP
jgi:hypothetical protein